MEQLDIPLNDAELARIKARLYSEAGISLSDAKRTLVVSRLSRILRTLDLPSFDAYVTFLETKASPQQEQDFVNALTTNLTRFFREDHHFTHLVDYVRGLVAQRAKARPAAACRLRLWSAGCSTGQEPYTMAMVLLDACPELRRWDFRILATDIDTSVLAKAEGGIYPNSELKGLSPERSGLFEIMPDGNIRVPLAARSVVTFRPLNLMGEWPMKGPFDAIFCRNVTIYFDKPTQTEVFSRLGQMLSPGGFLYIGHSENLGSGAQGFKLVDKTTYQFRSTERARDAA